MAKNIASPQQSAAAASAVEGFADVRTGRGGSMNKFSRTRPLTRFEREALTSPIEAVYIYNISPIFKWQKDYPGLGMMTMFPRRAEQEYSDPIILEKRLVRTFDGGNRIQRLMVETPLELAQDFLVCSPEYPGRPQNNLTTYGLFYTTGKRIEEVATAARQEILDKAELAHRNKLLEKVSDADAYHNSSNLQYAISEVHRQAALYLQAVGAISDLPDWVSRRAKLNATDECAFCGFDNKRGVAKCRNCGEILNHELYAKLQAQVKGAKKAE